jgi:protein-disulfide isomerase
VVVPTPEPTPDLDFEEESHAVMGDPDAPIVMVEFSDYQCPFCLRYFNETLEQIKQKYVDTGKVFYVFKDFPITQIHPQAPKAAEAAECAGDQDQYWAMHDRIFQGQQAEWNNNPEAVAIFKGYAEELGLDMDAFNACLDSGKYADEVAADLDEGIRAGVTGTPTFFINGEKVSGAQPFQVFEQLLDALLAQSP